MLPTALCIPVRKGPPNQASLMGLKKFPWARPFTDPGIFFKGGPGPMVRKQTGRFFVFFLVLNLFNSLQGGSNGFITEKTILFQHFPGGSNFFPGGGGGGWGSKCYFFIETHRTCDFPIPLWIRTWRHPSSSAYTGRQVVVVQSRKSILNPNMIEKLFNGT